MSKEMEVNCKNYSNFQRIGMGTYGIVYRAIDKKSGFYFSIKEIMKDRFNDPKEILKREVDIMKKMENENSINFKEYIESNDYYYIVMDYCEYNLETFLKQKRAKTFFNK